MNTLKEIGGTVFLNHDNQLWMLGADQRVYRLKFYEGSEFGTHPEGTVVRIYFEESGHNGIKVTAVEEWGKLSYLSADYDAGIAPSTGSTT